MWPKGLINNFYGIKPLKNSLDFPGIPAILTLTMFPVGWEDLVELDFFWKYYTILRLGLPSGLLLAGEMNRLEVNDSFVLTS